MATAASAVRGMADDAVTVGDALQRLYAVHQLPEDGGERESWFHVRIGPVSIPLPNPPARQRAVFIHDVNHVLTGYNAEFSDGEMSIAAYEVGTGCGRVWVAWFLNLALLALGAVMRPRLVLRAFIRGREAASLYVRAMPRADLRAMTVGEVRRMIRLDGPATLTPARHHLAFASWVAMTWLVVIGTTTAIVLSILWGLR